MQHRPLPYICLTQNALFFFTGAFFKKKRRGKKVRSIFPSSECEMLSILSGGNLRTGSSIHTETDNQLHQWVHIKKEEEEEESVKPGKTGAH